MNRKNYFDSYNQTDYDAFEGMVKELFSDDLKNDKFCAELWSSFANVIWLNHSDKEEYMATFRYAGSVIAELSGRGDYMDWYCIGEYETVTEYIYNKMIGQGWIPYTHDYEKIKPI